MSNKIKEKPDGFYQLRNEIESLKRINKDIQNVLNKQVEYSKYLNGVIKKLAGELIQLSDVIDGLKNYGRRK